MFPPCCDPTCRCATSAISERHLKQTCAGPRESEQAWPRGPRPLAPPVSHRPDEPHVSAATLTSSAVPQHCAARLTSDCSRPATSGSDEALTVTLSQSACLLLPGIASIHLGGSAAWSPIAGNANTDVPMMVRSFDHVILILLPCLCWLIGADGRMFGNGFVCYPSSIIPSLAPASPTFDRPTRKTLCLRIREEHQASVN